MQEVRWHPKDAGSFNVWCVSPTMDSQPAAEKCIEALSDKTGCMQMLSGVGPMR